MNKIYKTIMVGLIASLSICSPARDVFDMTLVLEVPRVYDNMQSLGYRKPQTQTIKGEMIWEYDEDGNISEVSFTNFVNRTHKMTNGKHVTYQAYIGDEPYPRFLLLGSNKTKKFNIPNTVFQLILDPIYNIGTLDEDNSLYLTMSSTRGSFNNSKKNVKMMRGWVSGTIGCGCAEYEHISPTRWIWWWGASEHISDVAGTGGRWTAKYNKKKSCGR